MSSAGLAMPAIFLDRDGTINVEKNYLYRVSDWEWIPGAKEAIKQFKQSGYRVVVVSNQAGIARGMFASSDVERLHAFVQQELACIGTQIDAFYYCPHHPEFGGPCSCRKPAPGMLLQAALDLNLNLAHSWMIGDKQLDVHAGLAAGVSTAMVGTGYGIKEQKYMDRHATMQTLVFDSLMPAAQFILAHRAAQKNQQTIHP